MVVVLVVVVVVLIVVVEIDAGAAGVDDPPELHAARRTAAMRTDLIDRIFVRGENSENQVNSLG